MKFVGRLISAIFLFTLKGLSILLYRTEAKWITPIETIEWENLRLAAILNHTSLYEPLFVSALPNKRIWRGIRRVVVPVADVTMKRPLLGGLFRVLCPNIVPITRKRDETWDLLLDKAHGDSVVMIFPEGRMKRADGLDKHGKPMSVKGGIADLLLQLDDGKMLIAYSGGLHHVQAPGQKLPKIFQKISITFEEVDIKQYKKKLFSESSLEFRKNVISDLESRMKIHCS